MIKKYLISILLCVVVAISAQAQNSIKLTIGAAPGAATDAMARALQQLLLEETDIKLLIEYKPGVGGEISYTQVAQNKNEPNLLLMFQSFAALNAKANTNYNWRNDFVMINYLGYSPMVLVTGKESGIRTWQDLINWPANKPLSIGVTLLGSGPGMCGDFLMSHLKKDWIPVEYKASTPAVLDLMGGHHLIGCHIDASVRGQIESGLLTPLVSIGPRRLALLPNIPSTDELGIKDSNITTWQILGANKMVDSATIEKIQKALNRVMQDPVKRKKFSDESKHSVDAGLTAGGAAAAIKFTESEIARFQKNIR